ncbi:MmgE/PrpD family protein [Geodermatophilus sp. DF01-2]|uniref:MmgE/PrpD family protein n=1 Tax=Geodermatophilus sp. DF01-2 TaxID=2559610 RepID=UPI001073A046|nr:MmgE/PrpD family protein [Geodermatophilus sp. DF01_2]TFV60874.1 MmgE/PrpD family protein [Geodermatophilus sp. DF01_2]
MSSGVTEFIRELEFEDLPAAVVECAHRCLLDLVAVAAAGSTTELSRIARQHALDQFLPAGRTARLLFDGRPVSSVGAAFANAAAIDSMDAHDGHRLTKGHAGVSVLPAALALLDPLSSDGMDLLTTLVVGYEVATRAGIALHASAGDYHSSGAWNAVGAAAAGSRALALDAAQVSHALGIAEYHAPRGPMTRVLDHPTMVKDSSAGGCQAGVSASLLASQGFTGAPPALVESAASGLWSDLGSTWRILEQYVKPYPVCRWAHPAVDAVISLVEGNGLAAAAIEHIDVQTFRLATRLAVREPLTTEQAQYSLPFPVAVAAARGRLLPCDVTELPETDAVIRRLARTMTVTECAEMSEAFPARRQARVTVRLADGRRLTSGLVEACGDPEDPLADGDLAAKYWSYTEPVVGRERAQRLHALVAAAPQPGGDLRLLTDDLYAAPGTAPPDLTESHAKDSHE